MTGTADRIYHQCGLGAGKDQFTIFLQGRSNFEDPVTLNYANEIVIAAWPVGIPEKLPLEAFVYVSSGNPGAALAGAQFMQQDYFEQTTDYLPVVRLTFEGDVATFSFHGEEQSVSVVGN